LFSLKKAFLDDSQSDDSTYRTVRDSYVRYDLIELNEIEDFTVKFLFLKECTLGNMGCDVLIYHVNLICLVHYTLTSLKSLPANGDTYDSGPILLNYTILFTSLTEANTLTKEWILYYNKIRMRISLQYKAPALLTIQVNQA